MTNRQYKIYYISMAIIGLLISPIMFRVVGINNFGIKIGIIIVIFLSLRIVIEKYIK